MTTLTTKQLVTMRARGRGCKQWWATTSDFALWASSKEFK